MASCAGSHIRHAPNETAGAAPHHAGRTHLLSDDADGLDRWRHYGTHDTGERRSATAVGCYPFIRVSRLQEMTGVSAGHLRRAVGLLSRLGLAHHLRIGRTAAQRHANESRLCLTGDGLRYLSRVDRSSLTDMNRHWLVTPHPGVRRGLSGSRTTLSRSRKARVLT